MNLSLHEDIAKYENFEEVTKTNHGTIWKLIRTSNINKVTDFLKKLYIAAKQAITLNIMFLSPCKN